MMTLKQFENISEKIPTSTAWLLADLGELKGRQELFTRQSPQKLKVLREHAIIESSVSSNRIEGVQVDRRRVGTIIFGKSDLWPYINCLLFILKQAFGEFEQRAGQIASPKGAKTEIIISAVSHSTEPFNINDILKTCPGVSVDLVRRTLKNLRSAGKTRCIQRGRDARWEKVGKW